MTPRHFAWQAWHLVTSTFVSRGRRGTWRHPPSFCVAGVTLMALGWLWWRAWSPLVAGDAAALCVAGVALGDIHLRFTWQAWHLETSTFVSRGRRGSYGIGLALVARLVAVGRRWRRGTLRGRRGTWWHPPSFHVAGVALGDIHLRFAWQAWYLWHWAVSGGALGRRWRRGTLRGRRGTWWHAPSFHVASKALGDIHLRFAWQAWHLETFTFVLRGRRRTYGTGLAMAGSGGALGRCWSPDAVPLCVAGVALGDMHLPFMWQAWHLVTSTFVSRGRHGTWWHPPSFCMAGVALGDIHLRFAWQAWHLVTSSFVWHGRRGTYGTGLALAGRLDTPSSTHHLSHTPLYHTPSVTHHVVTDHVSHTIFDTPSFTHTTLSHTISHTTLSHTIFHTPSLTHHLSHTVKDHPSHTTLSHTIFDTPSFTHHLSHTTFSHNLSHTTLSHTIFHTPSQTILHTPLCHTPSFTHNFVTHHLSTHHLSHTALSHTIFRHTIFHTPLCHTPFFTHNFVTRSLSHTHTPSVFVTHHLSHTTLSHTTLFYFSILYHLFCLSFFPRPRYNIWCSLLEEVALWGYPVL